MNKKKLILHLNSIQNLIDTIRLELEEDENVIESRPNNTISIPDFIRSANVDLEDDVQYAEESDDGPPILLNSKAERDFYERFRLGD
jgi:hypothetical protein